MPTYKENLIIAVQAALDGDWHGAHNIAQDYNDVTANWLHAVLHKMEGDAGNSRYWYTKTHERKYEDYSDATQELMAIAERLKQ